MLGFAFVLEHLFLELIFREMENEHRSAKILGNLVLDLSIITPLIVQLRWKIVFSINSVSWRILSLDSAALRRAYLYKLV